MTDDKDREVHDAKMEDEMENRFADAILRGLDGPHSEPEPHSQSGSLVHGTVAHGGAQDVTTDESHGPIAVVELMAEGGGETVYGQCKSGTWSYWRAGTSWGLDENDDEVTTKWKTDPVDTLDAVMPEGWFWLVPRNVNAESRTILTEWYEDAVTKLDERDEGVLGNRWRKGLQM